MKVTKVSFSLLLFRTNISVNVLAIIRFVDEPCNLMFWFKLQLFLNVDPKIRLIGFGAQLSAFYLLHSFKDGSAIQLTQQSA
jgi:hypothetical protein